MALDPVKNFVFLEVSGSFLVGASTITLVSGGAAKLPVPATDGAFNLTLWNETDFPNPAEAGASDIEIVRVTSITGEVLTITRAQESTTAIASTAGKTYKMLLGPTKKMIDDIEEAGTKISIVTTAVTVVNTSVETNLISVSIPANTLGTNNGIKARLMISNWQQTSGVNPTLTIKLKYGATELVYTILGENSISTSLVGYFDVLLLADGSTSAQVGSFMASLNASSTLPTGSSERWGVYFGTATEDSTGALNLIVTAKHGAANVANTFTMSHAIIEVIQ